MALIHRLTRLFSADIHAVIDRLEEPTLLLNQCIREMEASLHQHQQQLKQQQTLHSQLGKSQQDIGKTIDRINQELDICFDEENKHLIRTLLKRRLEQQAYLKHIAEHYQHLTKVIDEQQKTLQQQQQELLQLQHQADLLANSTQHQTPTASPAAAIITEEDVDIAYLQEQAKRATHTKTQPTSPEAL